jgi:hypothetical protein
MSDSRVPYLRRAAHRHQEAVAGQPAVVDLDVAAGGVEGSDELLAREHRERLHHSEGLQTPAALADDPLHLHPGGAAHLGRVRHTGDGAFGGADEVTADVARDEFVGKPPRLHDQHTACHQVLRHRPDCAAHVRHRG